MVKSARGRMTLLICGLLVAACAGAPEPPPPSIATAAPASAPGGAGASATAAASAPVAQPSATTAPEVPRASTPPPPNDCRPGALTPAQGEGPFYKANPPQRSSLLEAGSPGTRLLLTGIVRGTDCQPIAGARVDFWQTDAAGVYDNAGYGFRGYQIADAAGAYRLESVVPAEYPGRTTHIHVKVTPPGGPTLTSQLYFPDVARKAADGGFRPELVVRDLVRGPEGVSARFDFVVAGR